MTVYVKPFIRWIWLGAILMALGGIIAAADKRYRLLRRQEQENYEKKRAPSDSVSYTHLTLPTILRV